VRIVGRIGVGVAVLGLVLGTTPASNAAPPGEKPRPSNTTVTTVTLVTGDQVTMRDGKVLSIRPGTGREKMPFSTLTADEHVYVLPADARQLVTTGQVDRRLFDLTTLIEFGYDDAHRDTVPLIVTHPEGKAAPRVAGSRQLASINGIALAADKSTATWDALTDGTTTRTAAAGVAKVWLDGKRQSTLEHSVS
jgi:hypothetical protein